LTVFLNLAVRTDAAQVNTRNPYHCYELNAAAARTEINKMLDAAVLLAH
jgi:hypothetical protein